MRKSVLVSVLVVIAASAWAVAAEKEKRPAGPPPELKAQVVQTAEEQAVRKTAEAFAAAFNKGDAKAVAALWTARCEYVDETGRIFRGREAVEKEYASFFAKNPGVKMELSVSSLNVAADNAAVEDGFAVVKDAKGRFMSRSYYTALHSKEGDKWLMASVREYLAPQRSIRQDLQDIDWLVGDWTASKGTKALEFAFKWIVDKKFLELTYAVKDKDTVIRSGIRIIGTNPSSGGLESWSFDSSGGHGGSELSLHGNGWIADSHGVLPDGRETASTEVVSRTDPDAFTWQSVKRSIAGQRIPDSKIVLLKRKSR